MQYIIILHILINKVQNHVVFWNFKAIFEILRKNAKRCMYIFHNSIDNYEVMHKHDPILV